MAKNWGDLQNKFGQQFPDDVPTGTQSSTPPRTPIQTDTGSHTNPPDINADKDKPGRSTAEVIRDVFVDPLGNPKVREIALFVTVASVAVVFIQDNQAGRVLQPLQLIFTFFKCGILAFLVGSVLLVYRIIVRREEGDAEKRRYNATFLAYKIGTGLLFLLAGSGIGWMLSQRSNQALLVREAEAKPLQSKRVRALGRANALYADDLDEAREKYQKSIKVAAALYGP